MPTYEYECRSCRHRFERFQPITARAKASCPRCQSAARRLISAGAGFLFKGSGFYITDYRSPSYREGQAAESKSTSQSESKSIKPESKSAEPGSKPSRSPSKGSYLHGAV